MSDADDATHSGGPVAEPTDRSTRVVAIGASAGGLEPLEQLFSGLPSDTGCSFVVVQHLSPDFRSMMAELLQRHTDMPIERLSDGLALRPNHVYLNLPRVTATLQDDRIRLKTMSDVGDLYRPIDRFLASVARERGAQALAIVLSGTASDGTEGASHVREAGGQVIAQSLETARFDSMPRAVMDAGLDDAIGNPAEIADLIVRWANGARLEATPLERIPDDPIASILALVRRRYETDFTHYKPATVGRRIHRRAELRQCGSLELYYDLLIEDADELDELYGDILIEVTAFFRDREAFDAIESLVMPALVEKLESGEQLRVWIAGCASGEEAYSLAMLLIEQAEAAGTPIDVKILATDVHGRSLERANAGDYPRDSVAHMPAKRVMRFFDVHEDSVQVKSEVRKLVLFSTHDVLRDTPFSQIDLLSCRNLLIYFNDEAQEQVLTKFHFALQRKGFLVLGPSESTAGLTDEFEILDARWRLYRKRRNSSLQNRLDLVPLRSSASKHKRPANVPAPAGTRATARRFNPVPRPLLPDERTLRFRRAQTLALEQIVAEYAPPGFLLTGNGDIVHIFGDAGQLLPLRQGAFSRRITDLIRPEFRAVLFAALQKAGDSAFERLDRRLFVREPGQPDAVPYDLSLSPVETSDEDIGFLLLTIRRIDEAAGIAPNPDAGSAPDAAESRSDASSGDDWLDDSSSELLNRRIRMLEHSLRSSEESLQTTIEELETSNEELQSTNEELTASNEELQSTNEELHSVNEELYTVSAEHQRKISELSELTDDIDLLLKASEIGTVHFDRMLRVKRFSATAGDLFQLTGSNIGKHADAIDRSELDIGRLARRVFESGKSKETQAEIDGKHLLVRLRPSVGSDDQINGVLVSCFDLTRLVEVQNELLQAGRDFKAIVEDTESFIVRWRADDDTITYCNSTYAGFFGSEPEDLIGKSLRELIPDAERERFFEVIASIPADETRYLTVLRELPDGGVTYTVGYSRAIPDESGSIVEYQSTGQDLSEEYRYRRALEQLVGLDEQVAGSHDERIRRILEIGLDYFELEGALLSQHIGGEYHVIGMAGRSLERYELDQRLPLDQTICGLLDRERTVLSFGSFKSGEHADHPACLTTDIEAYIGVGLKVQGAARGSVSFSSDRARPQGFSVEDESFMLLLSSWIATLVDARSRLDGIADENRYYQSLYLNVPVMMFLADESGTVLEVSDLLLERLGHERDAVVDHPTRQLFAHVDAALATGALLEGNCRDLPVALALGGGGTLDCEMSCRLRDIGSLQSVRMCVLVDVSERNRALAATEDHNRRLAAANENLNQFAFVASHDLQEPLRKIQQFSSFLEEDYAERIDEDGRYHLRVIVDAAERMSTLIRDLLQYSRTTRDTIEPRRLSLRSLVDEVLDDLELPVADADAEVVVGAMPSVNADPVLLRQLLTNLFGNAFKYRDPTRRLRLEIRTGEDDPDTIEVRDNGIGFDSGYAERIFEPFTRLNTVQDYPGSGIGLAICAAVCRKHGWRLAADSVPGEGSVFRLDLNPARSDEVTTADALAAGDVTTASTSLGRASA